MELKAESVFGFDTSIFPKYGCDPIPDWAVGILFRDEHGAEVVLAILEGDLLVNIETAKRRKRRGFGLAALEMLVRKFGVRRSVPINFGSEQLHEKAGFYDAGVEWCHDGFGEKVEDRD